MKKCAFMMHHALLSKTASKERQIRMRTRISNAITALPLQIVSYVAALGNKWQAAPTNQRHLDTFLS